MIHEILNRLERAMGELGYTVEPLLLERWCVLIHEAMAGQARHFHSPLHLLALAQGVGPIETLAILFHDLVYLQVDIIVPPPIQPVICRHVVQDGGEAVLKETAPEDKLSRMVLDIFGVRPGERLSPYRGLNELLSALVASAELGGTLGQAHLAQVVACIEGTIPFRPRHASFSALAARLGGVSEDLGLGLGEEEVVRTVQMAVRVANRDVGNFAEEDVGRFLDNTWMLLPETNPALRSPDLYSIGEYRRALEKIEGFLSYLDPAMVFHEYEGVPEAGELARMTDQAARNLGHGVAYLQVKLLTIALLEALALQTGGNAPLALFMGDIPRPGVATPRLESFLPAQVPAEAMDHDPVVMSLLAEGRASESSFDLRRSPLSAFLYRGLGQGAIKGGLGEARRMFKGEISPLTFLDSQPPWAVSIIAKAASAVAGTRRRALEGLSLRYEGHAPQDRGWPAKSTV